LNETHKGQVKETIEALTEGLEDFYSFEVTSSPRLVLAGLATSLA
jgi:predicted DNA-binding protein